MAPDRGSFLAMPSAGSSYQAIDSNARSRSRSPLDGVDTTNEAGGGPPSASQPAQTRRQDAEQRRSRQAAFLASRASQPQNFTVRSVLVGCLIGTIICLSNTYFGLQTGWISGMAMPASLLGFAWFKAIGRTLRLPFTSVENVLIQCVAGAVGTMPLGVGLVGVMPALDFLLKKEEGGTLNISLGRLIAWSVGVCFFGVFVAVPLRREVLIREKLKFPTGTATGLMIGVLHGDSEALDQKRETEAENEQEATRQEEYEEETDVFDETDKRDNWKTNIRRLTIAFGASGIYTLLTYFIPQLRSIPILGLNLSDVWQWNLNPSPAYAGQGIIMGPATTIHMLFGAIFGWALLSPLAKRNGWAPGPVGDWETGSKGWIVWASLAIMLADSLVSLGWLILRPVLLHGPEWYANLRSQYNAGQLTPSNLFSSATKDAYQRLDQRDRDGYSLSPRKATADIDTNEADAPAEHLPSWKITYPGLFISVILCIGGTHIAFPGLIPLYTTILAVIFSLLLSIMGIRALGETDLNPVSGISKLTQLVFAAMMAKSPTSVPANLIAGAISESAALQAGDMMQDLKTGHILGASPKMQFYGQMLGSGVGAVVASMVYKLYTNVYEIPEKPFEVPTGFVWLMTARLVLGQGLPEQAGVTALAAGLAWALLTALRLRLAGSRWQAFVPGGIAVAVGMYNTPSFTLARTAGGLVSLWWRRRGGKEEVLVVVASGLILGEGVVSIVNLLLASARVPHL